MGATVAPPRPRLVCAGCSVRLVHRLFTLHAEEETVMVCGGVWESLPKWLQDGWTLLDKKGKSLTKRRELVREMREHFIAAAGADDPSSEHYIPDVNAMGLSPWESTDF